jgi:hypothetical protein
MIRKDCHEESKLSIQPMAEHCPNPQKLLRDMMIIKPDRSAFHAQFFQTI